MLPLCARRSTATSESHLADIVQTSKLLRMTSNQRQVDICEEDND